MTLSAALLLINPMIDKKPDIILVIAAASIIFCGIFALASTSAVGSSTRFYNQILLGLLPGLAIAYAAYKTPLPTIQKYAPYLFFLSIILIAIALVPSISTAMRGGTRWLSIGPLTFQPSELIKLTFILYTASWISVKTKKAKKWKASIQEILIPFMIVSGLIAVILKQQSDLSTLAIILVAGFVVYFAAKTPFWHSLVLVLIGILIATTFILSSDYRRERVYSMLRPNEDTLGAGHQSLQAKVAVGSGGLFGRGVGMSLQKYGHVPLPASDSIFAIYAEETGFVGSTLLMMLFLFFFWRIFLVAKNNQLPFGRLVAIGICGWFFSQTIIHVASNIGGPVTGVPLPFISHGKSHLIVEMMALGVLLNASRYSNKKK